MWNSLYWIRFKSLWQDVSYRRLAYALALSGLLHLFLIGKFHLNFIDFTDSRQVIEAHLVLPKVTPQPTEQPLPVKDKSAINPAYLKKPADLESPPAELATPAEIAEPADPVSIAELPKNELIEPAAEPEIAEPVLDNLAEEVGLIINPKPYQYIESEFDVYTDKDTVVDRAPAGSARMVFQILPSGEQYKIESLIQAKGLAALLIPDLLQTSEGYLDQIGLEPAHYLYKFGDKKEKTYRADFDWESKKLSLRTEKGEQKLDLAEGTQDLLSFMYQFMFVPPLQNMQILITNGKKLGVYDYSFEGEELIVTKMGELNTLHLARQAAEGEKKTELWLALDYRYVPVKIRETDKDGKVYELLVTDLKTERAATSE